MKEKIRLLIEEAGCDEGQAELALEAVQYDLQKAIRNIGSLLRDFVVVKGKFCQTNNNLFGLFIVIVNIRTYKVVRIHTVITYNPIVFETDLHMQWVIFEKQIFAYRLQDGSLRPVSQEIEQFFYESFAQADSHLLYAAFQEARTEDIIRTFTSLIQDHLSAIYRTAESEAEQYIKLLIDREEVNLTQFRHLEQVMEDNIQPPEHDHNENNFNGLKLKVCLKKDQDGLPACELTEGVVVYSQIVDERDIAQYLGRLMGGRSGSELIHVPSSVISVRLEDNEVEIQTELAPNIIGSAKIPSDMKLKVIYYEDDEWGQKIFPW
ncbi:MAG: hypothetical protein ABII23_01965 [bacterium]